MVYTEIAKASIPMKGCCNFQGMRSFTTQHKVEAARRAIDSNLAITESAVD